MGPVLTTLRRTLAAPSSLAVTALAVALAWLGSFLASAQLGADEGFLAEVRAGSLLLGGALVLSLAEPLTVLREARGGLLALRAARGGGFALRRRWLGLLLATLPTVLLCAWAAGGPPAAPLALLADLGLLCAGGLALGAFLERPLLVPALWCLAVLAQLRPWLGDSPAAWLLPRMGGLGGAAAGAGSAVLAGPGTAGAGLGLSALGAAHALCWCAGMLLLADWRLSRCVGRGA
ncbi:MAG TPA: hypothetical protein VK824_07165 [Planctomycetota bacterium]|nr:hypothetical protein [Planctomycetota bacterium]